MATITEDYVSFETAKLLKEKGFNEYVRQYYFFDYKFGCADFVVDDRESNPHNWGTDYYSAPTQQMATRFLRENHNLIIVVYPVVTDDEGSGGCLWKFSISIRLETKYISECLYIDPETAIDAAIKYCLENLI